MNQPFFEEKGQLIGVKARVSLPCNELDRKLEKALSGPVKAFMFGPKKTGTIGIITGGAGWKSTRLRRRGSTPLSPAKRRIGRRWRPTNLG